MAKFELDANERKEAQRWWDEHLLVAHKGKEPYAGAIGNASHYSIAFTTIGGPIVHIICGLCEASKTKLDFKDYAGCLTDFSDW